MSCIAAGKEVSPVQGVAYAVYARNQGVRDSTVHPEEATTLCQHEGQQDVSLADDLH